MILKRKRKEKKIIHKLPKNLSNDANSSGKTIPDWSYYTVRSVCNKYWQYNPRLARRQQEILSLVDKRTLTLPYELVIVRRGGSPPSRVCVSIRGVIFGRARGERDGERERGATTVSVRVDRNARGESARWRWESVVFLFHFLFLFSFCASGDGKCKNALAKPATFHSDVLGIGRRVRGTPTVTRELRSI